MFISLGTNKPEFISKKNKDFLDVEEENKTQWESN